MRDRGSYIKNSGVASIRYIVCLCYCKGVVDFSAKSSINPTYVHYFLISYTNAVKTYIQAFKAVQSKKKHFSGGQEYLLPVI